MLGEAQGIIKLDAEVADGVLQSGVAEQQPDGPKHPGPLVDQHRLGPPERVGGVVLWFQANAPPAVDDTRVLARREMRAPSNTAWEKIVAVL